MTTIPLGTWGGKKLSVTITETDVFSVVGIVENPDGGDDLAEISMTLPNPDTREDGFIHGFYVNPRKNDEDKKTYKGLGKAMLCAVFAALKKAGDVHDTDVITLEASGGSSTEEQRSNVKESDEQLLAFLRQYDGLLDGLEEYCRDAEGRDIERHDLTEVTCNIRENQRLVKYYESYGFKIVPGKNRGYVTEMSGTVGGILSACASKGGRKTRRTKASRRQRKRSTR